MYSRMNEVAALLGVRIGENFEIDTKEGQFVFDNKGLYSMHAKVYSAYILYQLLTGELNIKHQLANPWRPKNNDNYYTIDADGCIEHEVWSNDVIDINCYKLGNCYRTRQDAEQNRDKWIAFYSSDEILEV